MVKILVAEDEIAIRRGIIAILGRAISDVEFFEADDGGEALDIYNRELPSIVITDIKMPDCDGLEMISRINAISEEPPDFLILSGYSEFTYAKQAMRLNVHDYLLKPVDKTELIETVKTLIAHSDRKKENSRRTLKDTIKLREATKDICRQELIKLVSEKDESEHGQVKSKLQNFDINLDADMYICVAADYTREDDMELQRFSFENIALETMDGISSNSQFFYDEMDRMVIIIPGSETVQLNMLAEKSALRCIENLQKFMPGMYFFGIGPAVCLSTGIPISYRHAVDALRFKVFDPEISIVNYKRLKPGKPYIGNTDWRGVFDTLMERGQKSAYDEMTANLDMTPSIALIAALEERQGSLRENFIKFLPEGESLPGLPGFESNWSLSEWRKNIRGFMEKFRDICVATERNAPAKRSALDIFNYIKLHAGEEITLTTIAEHFGYNPTYISAMLKKETGKNFSKYLTGLRMDLARKLLRETRLSVKDIAKETGYQDAGYFNLVFKKETGKTPIEFRNT